MSHYCLMTEQDIWNTIQNVCEKAGISDTNFRKMKSNGRLADKWVVPVYLSLKNTEKELPLEKLQALAQ